MPTQITDLKGLIHEIKLPDGTDFSHVLNHYKNNIKNVIDDFKNRYGKEKQFLNWVELPQKQLSNIENIYSQAQKLKAQTGDLPLVVIGIGGSKHTMEFLLNLNGLGNKRKIYFYSDIDPVSFENFLEETGGTLKDLNFFVVSKSGTTFEPEDAFTRFENLLINEYQNENLSLEEAKIKAYKHFAVSTDKNENSSKLRRKTIENGYISNMYVHDDVGGRFSVFDDHGLFTLAYAGLNIAETRKILSGAIALTNLALQNDLSSNVPAQRAIFNIYSRQNGYKFSVHQLFGKVFEGGGENWFKQLYLESLKDFEYGVGKAPDSMHYATEGHFSPENRKIYNTTMTILNPEISENYKKYLKGIADTYSETTPLSIETLEVKGKRVLPEAIGEYLQSKHIETIYMGMLLREIANKPQPEQLPEILQPSVEVYKNKFKGGVLTPGK